mgnify:CR=1 FL=1
MVNEQNHELDVGTLVDLLHYRAVHQPLQIAYTFLLDGERKEISINYQDLEKRVRTVAASLQSLGAKGERALLLYQPGLEYIISFFGCLYAGVLAVPSYPPTLGKQTQRLQSIAASSQAKIALTTTSILTSMDRQSEITPNLGSMRWIATDVLDQYRSEEWWQPQISKDTVAFLQYTSGSSGTPKGVMVSHGNLLHNLSQIQEFFGNSHDSHGIIWLPPYHDMGLIGGILQSMYCGGSVTLMSPMSFIKKPIRWLDAISRYKATTSGGPDFAYDYCVRKITPEQRAGLDLSRWDVAFTGAEPIRARTLDRFANTFAPCGFRREAFYSCYGMAEATLFITGGSKKDPPVVCRVRGTELERNQVVVDITHDQDGIREVVSCGKPACEQKVLIVNPESCTALSSRQIGEIWVSGASVALGYWNQPELTQQTFGAYLVDGVGPFMRTGDLGFLWEGELFVTGRLKDLIIISGRNHYPHDIEQTVEGSHLALQHGSGAAFSIEASHQEMLVIAHEVDRNHIRTINPEEVTKAIRYAVSEQHDIQTHVILLLKPGSIPKTSSGKIQRNACRSGFVDGSLNVLAKWSATRQEN